jgi:hypothetical protein
VGPSAELAAVDDRALQRLVCTGAARLAAQMCQWLDLIAELVIRRIWADEGCRTPAIWLSYAVGLSPSAARDHVRVALRLRELHRVREAVRGRDHLIQQGSRHLSRGRPRDRRPAVGVVQHGDRRRHGTDRRRFPRRAAGRHASPSGQ